MRVFTLIAVLLLIGGCASNMEVTYKSWPSGADVYTEDGYVGKAPVTVTYPISEWSRENGRATIPATEYRWSSGDKTTRPRKNIICCQNSGLHTYSHMIAHPGGPGLKHDKLYGNQHEVRLVDQAQREKEAANGRAAPFLLEAAMTGYISHKGGYNSNGGGDWDSPTTTSPPPSAKPASTASSCSSDFNCGSGKSCIKAPYTSSGVCMTSTDSSGVPTYSGPSTDSVGVKTSPGCYGAGDCPGGFRCDFALKACVK